MSEDTTTKTVDETTTTTVDTSNSEARKGSQDDNQAAQDAKDFANDQSDLPVGDTSGKVERQGEVRVDQGARAEVLGGPNHKAEDDEKVRSEAIAQGKADALVNHNKEQQSETERLKSESKSTK